MKEFRKASYLKERILLEEEKQRNILSYDDKKEVNQSIIHTRQDLILLVSLQKDNLTILKKINLKLIILIVILILVLMSQYF